ncbi:MAG TPA: branched-chain amino acid ABC transporter substrate-binding protein [Burkholderiales bacterium]|nr:branched-chain amino acid ABC transporter substrate-binding protein [Burkholderiales bacterium]
MNFRLVHTIAFVLLAACAGFVSAADTVRLAFFGGLSGPQGHVGEEQLKAFKAAADRLNARGGLPNGKKIEIVAFDNKNTPQETLVLLKQATDQDIRYAMATVSSVAHAISDALVKYNERNPDKVVLFLDYNALDPALTEEKCNFWHFRFESHASMQANAMTDYMAKQKAIRKVYLFNQDYAYGQAVARVSRQMLTAKRPDIEIVGDELVPLSKVKDFAPYVAKIRASGADAVFTGNWGNDLSLLVKASAEAGLKADYYTLLGKLPGTWTTAGSVGADRIKTVDAWHINAADPTWEKTLVDARKTYDASSNMDYLTAFRVVEMLSAAIAKAGSDDPLKVAFALEGAHFAGPTGDSWMRREDHQIVAPMYVLRLAKQGEPGVKHDTDGTGYGWKTEAVIAAKDNIPEVKCNMERPQR